MWRLCYTKKITAFNPLKVNETEKLIIIIYIILISQYLLIYFLVK